ncbi:hypothetical protein NX786_00735 [Telluria mixta]|uniref:PRTase-CE domain-containing protein n=1 Tax=Telluria mixta TaxID=34071 RepID=A0ABT2BRX9_9BURK|nr:hypothetical protein [Telluria mixta]MCS0627873.1 hypothetical protein [Telluria mixta]WEM94009.1 hypothetical protein P0M04_21255 [Telluria mixta]
MMSGRRTRSRLSANYMSFFVPQQYGQFFEEVTQRFRLLIRKGVLSKIDEIVLDKWLSNFVSAQDKYLAARILDGLIFRSEPMLYSSIDQLLQCVLPSQLRQWDAYGATCIEEFLASLKAGESSHPVRFVAIDRSFANEEPGKSGDIIIRHLRQHGQVARTLTCSPEAILSLPESVKVLIFIDDIIGSGKQFKKFAKFHRLDEHAARFRSLYCPMMAYDDGVAAVKLAHPWLSVSPIELLSARHRFYFADPKNANTWAMDRANLLADVREHVNGIALAADIPVATKYSLELLVAFDHSTPNNTLPLLWAHSDKWHPLLTR